MVRYTLMWFNNCYCDEYVHCANTLKGCWWDSIYIEHKQAYKAYHSCWRVVRVCPAHSPGGPPLPESSGEGGLPGPRGGGRGHSFQLIRGEGRVHKGKERKAMPITINCHIDSWRSKQLCGKLHIKSHTSQIAAYYNFQSATITLIVLGRCSTRVVVVNGKWTFLILISWKLE